MSAMRLKVRARFESAISVTVSGMAATGPNTDSRVADASVALMVACEGYSGSPRRLIGNGFRIPFWWKMDWSAPQLGPVFGTCICAFYYGGILPKTR